MITLKEKEFLVAFKAIFWYQVRRKFGLLPEMNMRERFLRPSLILFYIVLLYFLTQNHHELLLTILTIIGCTWLGATAIDSVKKIYHRRYTLAKGNNGVRDIDEFTALEKLLTYFISACIVTGIFAVGMVIITFIRTGDLSVHLFLGMASIPGVILLEWFGFLNRRNRDKKRRDNDV